MRQDIKELLTLALVGIVVSVVISVSVPIMIKQHQALGKPIPNIFLQQAQPRV